MTKVTVQETANGDLYIQLPDELMNDLGWTEDTELVWIIEDDGRIILRKNQIIMNIPLNKQIIYHFHLLRY
jgi:hypothetical protein